MTPSNVLGPQRLLKWRETVYIWGLALNYGVGGELTLDHPIYFSIPALPDKTMHCPSKRQTDIDGVDDGEGQA
jgi:hypothetical protein